MNNQIEFKGEIEKIFSIDIRSEKFRKQEIIIKCTRNISTGTIIDYFQVSAINNMTEFTLRLEIGDKVMGSFRLKGNKFIKDNGDASYPVFLDLVSIVKV